MRLIDVRLENNRHVAQDVSHARLVLLLLFTWSVNGWRIALLQGMFLIIFLDLLMRRLLGVSVHREGSGLTADYVLSLILTDQYIVLLVSTAQSTGQDCAADTGSALYERGVSSSPLVVFIHLPTICHEGCQ